MSYTMREAQEQLPAVLERATDEGPQLLEVDGAPPAVVISLAEHRRLQALDAGEPFSLGAGDADGFGEVLLNWDLSGLDLERDQTPSRDVELW